MGDFLALAAGPPDQHVADVAALGDAIRRAYRRREELAAMRLRARELAEREFTASAVVPRWIRLFAEIADERATAPAGGTCV